MTTPTPLRVDLDAIERLDREATAGPWEAVVDDDDGHVYVSRVGDADNGLPGVCDAWDRPLSQANADWIALSRTALPELVAMLRERDAEVARLRQACEEADDALSRHRRDDMGNYNMEVEAAITTLRAALTNATGESE